MFNRMIFRYVELHGGFSSLPSHHVTVCFFFMSSGGTYWAWYVTHSSPLQSNKHPTAACADVCVCLCVCVCVSCHPSSVCRDSALTLTLTLSLSRCFAPAALTPEPVENNTPSPGRMTHQPLKGKSLSFTG